MDFQKQIESQIFRKKLPSAQEAFENICFVLIHEYHWTYEDLMNSPSPFVLDIVERLVDYKKKEQAAMKKKR